MRRRMSSYNSVSSSSSNVTPKNQLTTLEIIDRYENEICGPKQILTGDSPYKIANTEKNQIYNFLCGNNEANIYEALKQAINFCHRLKLAIYLSQTLLTKDLRPLPKNAGKILPKTQFLLKSMLSQIPPKILISNQKMKRRQGKIAKAKNPNPLWTRVSLILSNLLKTWWRVRVRSQTHR